MPPLYQFVPLVLKLADMGLLMAGWAAPLVRQSCRGFELGGLGYPKALSLADLGLLIAGQEGGVFLSASTKADMRVVDAQGSVLARVDAAGLQTYDAALSGNGCLLAAATFTADVKVMQKCDAFSHQVGLHGLAPGSQLFHSPQLGQFPLVMQGYYHLIMM